MAQASKTFRIFVSSTFSDLKAERNALQEFVFPRLRELCIRYDCRFQAIDLRWGVSEEAALDQQTMKICLEEIKRCQRVTPKPNFIVLLGDRYGWRPLPAEIPADEFEEIVKRVTDPADNALLLWQEQQPLEQKGWYRRDDNARSAKTPTVYCLQARGEQYADYGQWEVIEKRLRTILVRAAAETNLAPEALAKYASSATEQEIMLGAVKTQDTPNHVYCYFRSIQTQQGLPVTKDLPPDEAFKDFVDLDESGKLDEDAHNQLEMLKGQLSNLLPGNKHEYKARWNGNGVTTDHIGSLPEKLEDCLRLIEDGNASKTLCEDVWRRLAGVILNEVEKIENIDPLDKEIEDHRKFGEERAKLFTDRRKYRDPIIDYIGRSDTNPLAVWGESGSGKSALIARIIARCREQNTESVIVSRFIGATPASSDGRALLQSLCRQISRSYEAAETGIPEEYRELVVEFLRRLAVATAEKPLILFLDALDQLSNTDNSRNLLWLPMNLPEHVRMIVSTTPGECLSALEKKLSENALLNLEPMTRDEGTGMLELLLEDAQRTLQPEQREQLLSKFAECPLPLYLKLAFEEARLWRSYDGVGQLGSDVASDKASVASIINNLFKRLSDDANHGEMMVSRSMGYLAAAKNGLSEDELLDVLSKDENLMNEFKRRTLKSPIVDRLPVVVWSRLYFDMEPYLTERQADGAALLSFYHDQFRGLAEKLLTPEIRVELHQSLARYFSDQSLHLEHKGKTIVNVRKLSELPYNQSHGRMWSNLTETLCQLGFLQAKVGTGMTYDAINDFELAIALLAAADPIAEQEKYTRTLLNEFATAFNQEFYAFRDHPQTFTQQVYNNIFAQNGFGGPAGDILKSFAVKQSYPNGGFWLRRLNEAPDTSTSRSLRRTLAAHDGPVTALAVSPSGNLIVTGGVDGFLRIWQVHDGAPIASMQAHAGGVTTITWLIGKANEESKIVSAGRDQHIRVWNWQSERELLGWRAHNGTIRALKRLPAIKSSSIHPELMNVHTLALPDETDLVSCADDKTIRGWRSDTGTETWVLRGHLDRVFCLGTDGDQSLVTGSDDRTLKVWATDPPGELRTLRGALDTIRCVAVEPESDWAVSGGDDLMLRIWNLKTSKARVIRGHRERINCVGIGAGENFDVIDNQLSESAKLPPAIFSGSDDETIRSWDSRTGEERQIFRGHTGRVVVLDVEPQGRWISSGGEDGTVRFWRTWGHPLKARTGVEHEASVNSILSLQNSVLASASNDMSIRIWDRHTGSHRSTLRGHLGPVTCLAAVTDRCMVSGSADRTIKVWDVSNGNLLRTMGSHYDLSNVAASRILPRSWRESPGHKNTITCLARVDENHIISSSRDGSIILWNVFDGSIQKEYPGINGFINRLLISEQLGLIIATGSGREIQVWHLALPGPPRFLSSHSNRITCADISQGRFLATGGLDRTIKLWDLTSDKPIRTFEAHTDWVNCLTMDHTGQIIVSGGQDSKVIIWDAAGKRKPFILSGHTKPVRGVAIDSVARHVLSYGDDQWLTVWNLDTGSEIASTRIDSPISISLILSPTEYCCGTRRGGLALFKLDKPVTSHADE